MGTYYKLVCPTRKEAIKPNDIGDEANPEGGGIKLGPFVLNHTMQIAAYYAILGPWQGHPMLVVSDGGLGGGDFYYDSDDPELGWKDVTKEAIEFFVEEFPERAKKWQLKYIKPDDD